EGVRWLVARWQVALGPRTAASAARVSLSRLVPRREVRAREPGARLTRPPNGEWVRVRMSSPLRAAVFAGCALLWLSGAVWLVVHLTLEQPTPFGPLPSPWEPALLKVHGLLAVV